MTQTASPLPSKVEQACKYFWTVTVVTRSPHQDESAPGGPTPPVDQGGASGISACVKLLTCKFCTKNCYFFFFLYLSVVGGFVVFCFVFVFLNPPQALCV